MASHVRWGTDLAPPGHQQRSFNVPHEQRVPGGYIHLGLCSGVIVERVTPKTLHVCRSDVFRL
jgi:hypothetical protein